jgi:glutamate racemase
MPIGVFDSGVGGLTVLAALQRALPEQAFVYLGDNANAPYGERGAREITDLTRAGILRLWDRGCDLVVVACNTAAAVALRPLQEWFVPADRKVLGVLVPVIEALAGRAFDDRSAPARARVASVALFATPATVASRAFPRELRLRAHGVWVEAEACGGLVDALEAGDRGRAEAMVPGFVAALLDRQPMPEAAVLGCTHYPLVADAFRAALPGATAILSQPDLAAAALARYLDRFPRLRGAPGGTVYLTTGDPAQVRAAALRLTGRDLAFDAA